MDISAHFLLIPPPKMLEVVRLTEILLPVVYLVFVISTVLSDVELPLHPSYKWTFNIYYNSSSTEDVTTPCGTYYAETFLGSFVHSPTWLEAQCDSQVAQTITDMLDVTIAHRATVSLFKSQVAVSVNIYLEAQGADKELMIECGAIINETLQDASMLGESNFLDKIRHLEGKTDNDTVCVAAILSPHHFYYDTAAWVCAANYTYSEDTWQCVFDRELYEEEPSGGTNFHGEPTRYPHTTPNNGNPVIVAPEIPTAYQSTPAPSTESYTPAGGVEDDVWGLELMEKSTAIHLIEGGPEVIIDIRFWTNRSVVCDGTSRPEHCNITINTSIAGGVYSSPICRRTGQSIPQVAFGQPAWTHASNVSYCAMDVPEGLPTDTHTSQLVLRAVQDNKYDGRQMRQLNLGLTVSKQHGNKREVITKTVQGIPVMIDDLDMKATCQSINDPHITTFDGLEYNNYYEGEYVLYTHKLAPARVHVVYQRCSTSVLASCNCAVAIQSGDDVLVIDRCYRDKIPLKRISGIYHEFNPMSVELYLNGELTPGTRIFQEADGKKYFIHLPHGAVVKVMVSGMLINAWVVASPADFRKTAGLCGLYDTNKSTDMVFRNGTQYNDTGILSGNRDQPVPLVLDWRVDLDSSESLMSGVTQSAEPYVPPRYCLCQEDMAAEPYCAYGAHVNDCDILNGVEITDKLVQGALTPLQENQRRKRDVEDNTISVISRLPIHIDKDFVPPKYTWDKESHWNEVKAKDFCRRYIRDNYTIGQLCAENVPSMNFEKEIDTCTEDIQITGNTTWADSARDAMKEQCLEELQKNGSLNNDIEGAICIHDCSQHGRCVRGRCVCDVGYTTADCSVSELTPPYAAEMPHYGLCDKRNMNCSRVIVYGDNFVDSDSLTCYFQECQVTDATYIPKDIVIKRKAIFINYNAVECIVPEIRAYLISVSNNGLNRSDALLFLPFDPQCNVCNTFNTTCTKVRNSCIINDACYVDGDTSPSDSCMICRPVDDELQWTIIKDRKCHKPWWTNFKLPNWAVAVPAAIGGSIVGVLAGFLLYKCCCKHQKQRNPGPVDLTTHHVPEEAAFEDAILHRNRGLPVFSGERFDEIAQTPPESFDETYFYNDGRGVENGVNSTTYF